MILEDADLLSIGARLVGKLQMQHGVYGEQGSYPEDQRWLDSDRLKEVTDKWEVMVQAQIKTGEVFDALNTGRIFYYLKRSRPDIISAVIDELISSDNAFDKFITAIAERGISSANGKYLTMRDAYLEGFGDLNRIKKRAEERLQDPNLVGEARCAMQAVTENENVYISTGTRGW